MPLDRLQRVATMRSHEMLMELKNVLSIEQFEFAYFQMWQLWYQRNQYVHHHEDLSVDQWQQRIISARDEHTRFSMLQSRQNASSVNSTYEWQPTIRNVIKINIDAAIRSGGFVQVGVVARDSNGILIFAAARKYTCCWTPEVGEAIAILDGLTVALEMNMDGIMLESDCLRVISLLKMEKSVRTDLGKIIDDIKMLST